CHYAPSLLDILWQSDIVAGACHEDAAPQKHGYTPAETNLRQLSAGSQIEIVRAHRSQLIVPRYAVVFIHGLSESPRETWQHPSTGFVWYDDIAARFPHWE